MTLRQPDKQPDRKTLTVTVELRETSQAIVYEGATNTYTKGPMYCVYVDGAVRKHPLDTIWRVTEDYRAA